MTEPKDFAIADIAVHLAASKNKQYRANTIALYRTLTQFLQTNGLLLRTLLKEGEDPGPTLRIMRSDLSDEGFELIKAALHRWVNAVMAGKCAPTDDAILESSLSALRSHGPHN